MKVTITSLLLVITCVLFQSSVQAQQRNDTALQKECPHAWKITPQDPKLAEKSDAWRSKDSDQDGVVSLSYCWVFQPGLTTVKKLAKDKLMQLPASAVFFRPFEEMSGEKIRVDALPLGFSVYKELAFEIETKAVLDGHTITIRLPSIRTEQELSNLSLLYLDEDRELPGLLTWHPAYSGNQKTEFSTRTLTAEFEETSIFHRGTSVARVIVASFDKSEYDKSPEVDMGIRSVVGPPYVKFGEPFSYSVTVVNWSATGQKATDVVLFSVISDADFVSVTSTQGRCRKSVNSDPEIVCELGSLESTKAAVVTITVRGNDSSMPIEVWGESVFASMNTVRSKERDYTPENNSYESRGTIIRKVNP